MNCAHSVMGYCNKCAAGLIAENAALKASLDARPPGFIRLHEIRQLRQWHMDKYIASQKYTRTNPQTKAGISALHADAVNTLNQLFEENDKLSINEKSPG